MIASADYSALLADLANGLTTLSILAGLAFFVYRKVSGNDKSRPEE